LRLLIEFADDKAQVIDAAVGGFRTGSRLQRCGIAPTHHASQDSDFEKRDELLLRVDLAAGCGGGFGPPRRAEDAIAIEGQQAGEEAGPRCLRRGLEGIHLHVAFAHAEMIAVPCNRIADDLAVYARIVAELRLRSPLFEIEEVRKELECAALVEQSQTQQTPE